ncbi:hypothetical protein BN7_2697 [Wickerhamomyces ciferrii]|uniref:DUF1279 domain-containing protein n=1 Tax=Wickerhamomyces ciferrii (strain ATCC 14091 / BCRC 22168 / CBS 111 / JCM 3599 / NBRC 0793 / NRRL Y-1031 F-60-10) TaxID=1206466 RepID=K0KDF9_WICCF|nr:uncharacterized protein BN7_2697 [Wickerhamomyces ciferrii]CCH43150.1 hypothetical protein BN7_2697 [Wickerhamomyces ciferrii]
MFARIPLGIRQPIRANLRFKRFNSTKSQGSSSSSSSGTGEKKKTGIKALIQEYGYSALAIYLGLSAIDFPLCFIAVHSIGEDKIHEYQDKAKEFIGITPKEREPKTDTDKEESNGSIWSSTLLTEAILAYGIHKSLIFIRLPITAAITPSIVGKLRSMGFNIGSTKLKTIAQQAKTKTSQKIVDSKHAVANNAKFGTPVTKRQKWWSWFF